MDLIARWRNPNWNADRITFTGIGNGPNLHPERVTALNKPRGRPLRMTKFSCAEYCYIRTRMLRECRAKLRSRVIAQAWARRTGLLMEMHRPRPTNASPTAVLGPTGVPMFLLTDLTSDDGRSDLQVCAALAHPGTVDNFPRSRSSLFSCPTRMC